MPFRPLPSPSSVLATRRLIEAVQAIDEPAVVRWLAEGADPNRRVPVEELPGEFADRSLLYVAWEQRSMDRGSDRIMALLLDAGADPDACGDDVWDRVVIDRIETVFEAFVRNGAQGRWASTQRRHPVAQLFEEIHEPLLDSWVALMLQHGLAPGQQAQGVSVLGWAARMGDAGLAAGLIAQGADPERGDDQGRTMLDLVREGGGPSDTLRQTMGRKAIEALWVEHQRRTLTVVADGAWPAASPRARL